MDVQIVSPFITVTLIDPMFSGFCAGVGIVYMTFRVASYLFKD